MLIYLIHLKKGGYNHEEFKGFYFEFDALWMSGNALIVAGDEFEI